MSLFFINVTKNNLSKPNYSFKGLYEGFNIQTLTIVNDAVGSSLGGDLTPTPVIKNITIQYSDENGALKTATQPFSIGGKVKFTNLSYHAPRNQEAFFHYYMSYQIRFQKGNKVALVIF